MGNKISAGVRFMLFATLLFNLMKVCIKYLPHIPAIEIIFFRSVISLIISYFTLKKQRVNVWGNNKPILIGRGLAGSAALILFFTLLQQVPLATASTLQYLAPIFTTVLGIFLVKEKVKPIQFVFFGISFLGVLIVQGFDTRIEFIHLVMGISASFFMGLAYNFVRKLKTTEHPLVVIFYFPMIMLPISLAWSSYVWVQPMGWDWILLIVIGFLTQFAQFFLTKAFQSEELSKVSIINYIGLIYSLLFGYFLFDETFDWVILSGMGLVIVGVILNLIWKQRTKA